jgi:hypothetical protein
MVNPLAFLAEKCPRPYTIGVGINFPACPLEKFLNFAAQIFEE